MNYSYQGVTGQLVKVEDKFCPDMGAYQVASIRNADGFIERVSNKYDTAHSFPAMVQGETDGQKRSRMNAHWLRRAAKFQAMGTRTGRLLAFIAAGKCRVA